MEFSKQVGSRKAPVKMLLSPRARMQEVTKVNLPQVTCARTYPASSLDFRLQLYTPRDALEPIQLPILKPSACSLRPMYRSHPHPDPFSCPRPSLAIALSTATQALPTGRKALRPILLVRLPTL